MEILELISKINAAAPGAYLHKSRFGGSDQTSVWLDLRKIRDVALLLCNDPMIRLDWLENMSVAHVDDALVVTYFLRSWNDPRLNLSLRGSIVMDRKKEQDDRVELPSISDIWLTATPMELEASELFGIRFLGGSQSNSGSHSILPEGWSGFPLRKMRHSRGNKDV